MVATRLHTFLAFATTLGFALAAGSSAAGERGVVVWSKGADPEGNLWASVSSVVALEGEQTLRELEAGYARLLKAMFPAEHEDLGEAKAVPLSAVEAAAKFREGLLAKLKTMGYRVVEVRFTGDAEKDIQAFRLERAWTEARGRNTEESYKAFLAAFEGSKHAPDARQRYERLKAEREALEKRQREEAAWQKAQAADTIASYKAFLAAHGTSSFAEAARTKVRALEEAARQREDAAWAAAQKTDTMAAYKAFIAAHSQSRYLAEARKKLSAAEAAWRKKATAAFEAAKAKDTVVAYTAFLTSYADAPEADEAKGLLAKAKKRESEDNAWAHVQAQNTVASYKAFLAAHPQSRYLTQVRAKLAEAETALRRTQQVAFEKAKSVGTEEAYSRFLTDHPVSAHTVEARNLLRELQAARRRREEDAWSKAKAAHTEEAYSAFLRAHPQSTHARDARSRMEAIHAERRLARLRSSLGGRWPYDAAEAKRRQLETVRAMGFPLEMDLDVGRGERITVRLIPPGDFTMGSSLTAEGVHERWPGGWLEGYKDARPRHQVKLTRPFYMGSHEVTRGQFTEFVRRTGYRTDAEKKGKAKTLRGLRWGFLDGVNWQRPGFAQTDRHPVVCVSWNDAMAFCAWLSKQTNLGVGLPTEAQWEYACRAGSDGIWPWGDQESGAQGRANVPAEGMNWERYFRGVRDGCKFTAPVGILEANAFGLRDVIGNAWEWCSDWYGEDYYARSPAEDPSGPPGGKFRVLRGGGWDTAPSEGRASYRCRPPPTYASSNVGFRVVVSCGPAATKVDGKSPVTTPSSPPRTLLAPRARRGRPCFIATAAFGSASEPHVVTLRCFRDRWLLTNAPGRWVVDSYYRCSPPLADAIAGRPWARCLTRVVLMPIVVVAGAAVGEPARICLLAGTCLLAAALCRLWRRRRRRCTARRG